MFQYITLLRISNFPSTFALAIEKMIAKTVKKSHSRFGTASLFDLLNKLLLMEGHQPIYNYVRKYE